MKLKSIFLTGIFSLLLVSGLLAQSGERVYIREFSLGASGKTTIVIYEKGESKQIEIDNIFTRKNECLKSFGEILEKYFKEGYKLIATTSGVNSSYSQYILEKP